MRTKVLEMMVKFKNDQVLQEARRRFGDHVNGTQTIPPDGRNAVYAATAMNAHLDRSLWNDLWKLFGEAELHEERLRIAMSLCKAQSKELLLQVSVGSFNY